MRNWGSRQPRPWPIRRYFLLLVVLSLASAVTAAWLVDTQAARGEREDAQRAATFSAKVAAKQLGEHVALLRQTTAQLAANPQIAQVIASPEGCTLTFSGLRASDASHLDIIRPDGSVACSSRKLGEQAPTKGYEASDWFERGLREPVFVAPAVDEVVGGQMAIAVAPIPGRKGMVAGFLDLTSIGPELAAQYGGGRETVFLVTTSDRRMVVSRSLHPKRWAGVKLRPEQRRSLSDTSRVDLEGVERLYGAAPVPGLGWRVDVGEQQSAALAQVSDLRARQLQVVLLGLALFLFAAAVVYRKVVAPIRRLSVAVRETDPSSAGAGVPVAGPAEVTALGEDVNALIGAVQSELVTRRAAEAAAHVSEQSYRLLFEHNPRPMWVYDNASLRFLAVNDAAVEAYGYSREEFLSMSIDEIRSEAEAERLHAEVAQVLTEHNRGFRNAGIWQHRRKDGTTIDVEITSHDHSFAGRPARVVMAVDVSERMLLEEQLRQAQRLEAVGRLAGGVAHDFNNVLTVIGGYTESLLAQGDRDSEEALREISAATGRAAGLTRQLLAFSRQQVLQPQALVVNDVVEGLLPMLTRLIGEDVELVSSLAATVDPVLADVGQLEQVLVNLVVNARDAMPDGGRLTIQTANVDLDETYLAHHGDVTPGRHVMISVADDGSGMDAETQAHAFEPFYTTKPVGSGTGLGLATVHGIVKQSGGNVWVYSEPGKGTTIKIYLPATEVPADTGRIAGVQAPKPADGIETILLAEDEEALRTLVSRLLTQRGYDVITAESATDALRIAKQESRRIDLLVTDLIMPEMSGRELAEHVGAVLPGLPILFMSGYSDDAVMRTGSLESGAQFLEKPFTGDALASKVRQTLDAGARAA